MRCIREVLLVRVSVIFSLALQAVDGTTTKYYIHEEGAPGSFIGNLSDDLQIDADEDPNSNFRFMQETNSTLIRMRPSDGLLTVGGRIDRESICRRSLHCLLPFDVVVFFKEKYLLVHVEVNVKDVNDNSPEFPMETMDLEISESLAVGTTFPLVAAIDLDVGDNYIKTYELSPNNHFDLIVREKEDGSKCPELILTQAFDREVEENCSIKVSAYDGGAPHKTGSMTVNVKVLDYNDNSPVFEHGTLQVEILEDVPIGSFLLQVNASDPDQGSNGDVRYDFDLGTNEEVKDVFEISHISGRVALKSLLDYETKRLHEFNIQAYDMGLNSIPTTCKVVVKVVDVNDNPPEILINPMTSMTDGVAYITEAAAEESFVALVSTVDRDSGENGEVSLRLIGQEHFKLQQAYDNSLMVVTTATLDREAIPEYNLTFEAVDMGTPPFKTLKQYTIKVRDENDNAPTFSKSVYDVSVMENKAPRSYIATVVARDPDFGDNGRVTYKLIDNTTPGATSLSGLVSVDPSTGSLYTVSVLNYESLKQIDVLIEAADNGSPSLSSTAEVKIKVHDQNDNAPFIIYPILLNGSAEVPIPYNAPAGYIALRVNATDADEGANGELIYKLQENKQHLFSINELNGELMLLYRLSFSLGEVLEVSVAVTDNGRSPLTSFATMRFLVTDVAMSEEAILVSGKQRDLDASIAVIIFLALGCALLLASILAVAFSNRCCQRGQTRDAKKFLIDGYHRGIPPPLPRLHSVDSMVSDGDMATQSTTIHEQLSTEYTEDEAYNEQTSNSSIRVLRPLFGKSHSKPAAIWQTDRFTSQIGKSLSTEQSSIKDSGKGDSDFNDCDSDTSGEVAHPQLCRSQPQDNISLYTDTHDGLSPARETPSFFPLGHHPSSCCDSYNMAYPQSSVFCSKPVRPTHSSVLMREYDCYPTGLARVPLQTGMNSTARSLHPSMYMQPLYDGQHHPNPHNHYHSSKTDNGLAPLEPHATQVPVEP